MVNNIINIIIFIGYQNLFFIFPMSDKTFSELKMGKCVLVQGKTFFSFIRKLELLLSVQTLGSS